MTLYLSKLINKKDIIIDYIVAIFFIITTGSVFYVHLLSPAFTNIFLLLLSIANKLRINKNIRYPRFLYNNSWWYIVFIILLALSGDVYYNHTYNDRNLLAYIVNLLASYFIISSYDFAYFRKLLTNVVFVITLVGIPVFILNEFDYLPTYVVKSPGRETYSMFLFYTLGWPSSFHRFSGIWHEPGACQIVLNTILWLHVKHITRWNWKENELKKIVVIFIGAILTFSTGSYISLMLMIITVTITIKLKTRHSFLKRILIIIIGVMSLFVFFNSDTVQNKLFREETEENRISTFGRVNDAIALYKMTIERPLLGYGLGTQAYWKQSGKLGNVMNSSGLLVFSASFGIIWLLTFIIVVFIRLNSMGFKKEAFLFLLAIILMQINEDYIEFPLTCIFIFEFGRYAKHRKLLLSPNLRRNSYI